MFVTIVSNVRKKNFFKEDDFKQLMHNQNRSIYFSYAFKRTVQRLFVQFRVSKLF